MIFESLLTSFEVSNSKNELENKIKSPNQVKAVKISESFANMVLNGSPNCVLWVTNNGFIAIFKPLYAPLQMQAKPS